MNSFKPFRVGICIASLAIATTACAQTESLCPAASGTSLQVLGSGGPIADDGRASSAYLVWVDGHARVLIDAGGGTFLRFGEAGAKFADLDFVGISHFHADHSADLSTILKTGYFSGRKRDLRLTGPEGNRRFPGLTDHLQALLDHERGAYAYLGGYLDGEGRLVKLDTFEVPLGTDRTHNVYEAANQYLRVDALAVPHGIVPSISYRVSVGDSGIVFSSDQTGLDERFVAFAENADILLMHMAIPENASTSAAALHARPSQIGNVAANAQPQRLVISHLMARSLRDLDANISEVSQRYDGPISVAADLDCYVLD